MHAFEYTARPGGVGHIWAPDPTHEIAARELSLASERGRGFKSSSDAGAEAGDKLEVYTFWYSAQQVPGRISFAVDHATRGERPSGETCGTGTKAALPFQLTYRTRSNEIRHEHGLLSAVACDVTLPIAARLDPSILRKLEVQP